eukprot:TRINITY_DN52323_c0_g1_i1.p1 TRINITY_DN52323_c0_g1~~TRINITY_DN52323_c0_g1_i1.p1  ORF type:complete len:167 (-),score=38.42 TRINITY_DN52323_c0_g1_i1:51-551(-)
MMANRFGYLGRQYDRGGIDKAPMMKLLAGILDDISGKEKYDRRTPYSDVEQTLQAAVDEISWLREERNFQDGLKLEVWEDIEHLEDEIQEWRARLRQTEAEAAEEARQAQKKTEEVTKRMGKAIEYAAERTAEKTARKFQDKLAESSATARKIEDELMTMKQRDQG